MAKFRGIIGFDMPIEIEPGIFDSNSYIEKTYRGDIESNSLRYVQVSDKINEDVQLNCQISIVANSFLLNNSGKMRYVEYMGNKWRITSIQPKFPRVLITLGGLFHE